jgi:DNA repair exonuclease SbcCD ATPase subunit
LSNVTWYEKLANVIKSGGQISAGILADFETGLKNQQAKIKEVTAENERWRKSLGDVYIQTDEVYRQLKPLEQTLTTQVETEKKLTTAKQNAAKTQEELTAAYKKGLTSTMDLAGAVKELDDSLKKYDETINRVSKIEYDAPILEQLKNIKEATKQAAVALVDDTTKINESLLSLGAGGLPTDQLINVFKDLRNELEGAFIQRFDFGKLVDVADIRKRFVTEAKNLTQDQKNILSDLISSYEDVFRFINENQLYELGTQLKDITVAWNDFRGEIGESEKGGKALLNILGKLQMLTDN